MPDLETIKELYRSKTLAVRLYDYGEKIEFFVNDFVNADNLENVLAEILDGEADFTPAGKQFLVDYYDLDKLAETLVSRNLYPSAFKRDSAQDRKLAIIKWLAEVPPMEMHAFVFKPRPEEAFKDTLMPPR